jgi:hypothetical protein
MEVKKWTCLKADLEIAKEVTNEVTTQLSNLDHSCASAVYSTVSELVANIIQHAYPLNFKAPHDIECEITISRLDEETLTLAIADFGVTIPQSILNKISKDHELDASNAKATDAEIISDAAFPKAPNPNGRGRGLPSIFDFVSQGSLQSAKIASRHGTLHYTREINELTITPSPITGTLIEIEVKTGEHLDQLFEHGEIDIAEQFSKMPSGRFACDGDFSAEKFLNEFLSPAFDKFRTVTVNLDGTYGYGASFLDEAFGGLVRRGHSASSLKGRLNLVSTKNFHLPHQIWKYIEEANNR